MFERDQSSYMVSYYEVQQLMGKEILLKNESKI